MSWIIEEAEDTLQQRRWQRRVDQHCPLLGTDIAMQPHRYTLQAPAACTPEVRKVISAFIESLWANAQTKTYPERNKQEWATLPAD